MSFLTDLQDKIGDDSGGAVPPLTALPDIGGALTAGGSGNTYTLTVDADIAAYADGMVYAFRPGRANSGAATLNINGRGAKPIYIDNGSALVAVSSGDLTASGIVLVRYVSAANTGSGAWLLDSVAPFLAAKQPLDSDLTAIAALTTTSYGRAFLALADAAAARTAIGYTAALVPFTPADTVAATDVQAAIAELSAEKLPYTGGAITGSLSVSVGLSAGTNGVTFGGGAGTATMLLGTAGSLTFGNESGSNVTPSRQWYGTSGAAAAFMSLCDSSSSAACARWVLAHQRASATALQSGDRQGDLIFGGHDGTRILSGASIRAVVAASVATDVMPTRLEFHVNPGSASLSYLLGLDGATGDLLMGGANTVITGSRHFVGREYTRLTLPTPTSANKGVARVTNKESGKSSHVYNSGSAWLYIFDDSAVTIS